jgi:1-acyl-sn-glycerol-3-phosphate acyltransferase
MRPFLKAMTEALFKVLFTYDCIGEEHVPAHGPAVVAANHPSYLDPILLCLQVRRPIRFMAWDALFRVPLLGDLIRAFGAFPVDTRKGRGQGAYLTARALVEAGEVVGIFPEGKRSRTGWLEPELRAGAARLAWETGAPLVPATIAGAYRAWPHFRALPRPARIKVRYHEPIDPGPYRGQPEAEAVPALLGELRRRVERTLMPGVKADLRMEALYRSEGPWPRAHESLFAMAAALLVFWKTRSWAAVALPYGYVAYLLADHFVIPQRRLVKWIRNASPLALGLAYLPTVSAALGLPRPLAEEALCAVVAGAAFPYLYERGRTALAFIRGMVVAIACEQLAAWLAPTASGPHVALALFAAAFAWERRTVFWRYTSPILAAYAIVCGWLMLSGLAIVPHAIAGLTAWLITGFLPEGGRVEEQEEPEQPTLGLGL